MRAEPTLRLARASDAALLLDWRNDPGVRAASFSQDPVSLSEHEGWLARKLDDPDTRVLIAEQDELPIGQVRLERIGANVVEVHVSLAGEVRGQGFAPKVLALGAGVALEEFGPGTMVARVKPSNERSLRAFFAAGFVERERTSDAVVLIRPLGP
jgi:RimJ/RimL family protein N-acetyltransferase